MYNEIYLKGCLNSISIQFQLLIQILKLHMVLFKIGNEHTHSMIIQGKRKFNCTINTLYYSTYIYPKCLSLNVYFFHVG